MQALVARVRELDVRAFETASAEVLSKDLQPRTTKLLSQAKSIVDAVLDACEAIDASRSVGTGAITGNETPAVAPESEFERSLDEAIREGTFNTARVADIAFMAQLELRQRERRLESIEQMPEPSAVVAECDRALRRVTKALCAIDRAIAGASDGRAYLDYLSELELSLRVRTTYASFRRRIDAIALLPSSSAAEVERALRATGMEIAVIVGLPVYPALRLGDRVQLRSLQERILFWLKAQHRDLSSGMQIWLDTTAFVAILKHVDRRQELFEHDARVVAETLQTLAQCGQLGTRELSNLEALTGRDDEADALIERDVRTAKAWQPVLERLADEIGPRMDSRQP